VFVCVGAHPAIASTPPQKAQGILWFAWASCKALSLRTLGIPKAFCGGGTGSVRAPRGGLKKRVSPYFLSPISSKRSFRYSPAEMGE
jgi:hypothetical protein